MAQIPRPPKQGNVTTYVAKVAAGYGRILAGEVDADFDTIFGAWNAGADTVNIRDSAVTSAKLSADSVGPRELQDGGIQTTNLGDLSVTTSKLADGSVTDPKIVSLGWGKVTGTPTTYPPSGVAAGDLSGSYPSPALRDGSVITSKLFDQAVQTAKLADGAVLSAKLGAGQVLASHLAPNVVDTGQLAIDAATQFTDWGGAWAGAGALPIHLGDMTEKLVHLHSSSVVSRGGMIVVVGMFSGMLATVSMTSVTARLRVGGSATGVDGSLIGIQTVKGGDPAGQVGLPIQLVVAAVFRGTVGQTGPYKLTAQLTGLTFGAADLNEVQCIAFELA